MKMLDNDSVRYSVEDSVKSFVEEDEYEDA